MKSLGLAFVLALLAMAVSSAPVDGGGETDAPPSAADTETGPHRLITLLTGT